MKKPLLLFMLILLPFTARATIQIPDTIIINGEKHCLNRDFPLEAGDRSLGKMVRDALPKEVTLEGKTWRGSSSTDCSRNYIATWEIADNKLFLRKIELNIYHGKGGNTTSQWIEWPQEELNDLFAQYCTNKGIHATWVSDSLNLNRSEETQEMGYYIVNESMVNICLQEGVVSDFKQVTSTYANIDPSAASSISKELSDRFPWNDFPKLKKGDKIIVAIREICIDNNGKLTGCIINKHKEINDLREFRAIKKLLQEYKWPAIQLENNIDLSVILFLTNK
jgi:hypothetical protein